MLFKQFNTLGMKHRWSSGRILACHAGDPGSIPGRCKLFFLRFFLLFFFPLCGGGCVFVNLITVFLSVFIYLCLYSALSRKVGA